MMEVKAKIKNEEYSMRKLVITAALLVAAASSYAGTAVIPNSDVYSVSISMKTTKANIGQFEGLNYRTVTSKSYNGFYIVDTYDNGGRFDDDEGDNEMLLGYEGQALWTEVRWNDVVRIGKNNAEIEASGAIFEGGAGVTVFLRGFGTYDVKNNRVSSLNGSINAFLPPPQLFDVVYVFGYDLSDTDIVVPGTTIGFGTFSVKYSLEASKKWEAMDWDVYFSRKLGVDVSD
jgi:hypothetical protein